MKSINEFSPISQISTETIFNSKKDQKFKDVLWTTDIKTELPILLSKSESGSLTPITMMELFEESVKDFPKDEAFFFEKEGQWQSWTWNHYHKEVLNFAKALINIGIEPYKCVNILGFNSPEWFTAFIGGMYASVVPSGIYLTNNSETCVYIAEHSECACLVLDSLAQYKKYEKDLHKLKNLKAIVFYCELSEQELKSMINPYCTVYLWKDFVEMGRKANVDLELNQRIRMQNPGNCCNIVYTSGTTGQPKAVLLSHDNLTWTVNTLFLNYREMVGTLRHKIVSYLPLSHIAGQVFDILLTMMSRSTVYFARPDALSGSLGETLKHVNPTIFFAVPRVYEKFEDKIREGLEKSSFLKKKIAKYAMKVGTRAVDAELKGKSKPFLYPLFNFLVYQKLRKLMGLQNASVLAFGAAPLKKQTLEFFKSLGIILHNNYGMSESTGPQFMNVKGNPVDLLTAGPTLVGTDSMIMNPDKDGVGEICFRGRNRFMGYYKNEQATLEAIDSDGWLHSGDQGYIDKNGNLVITGRLKELIVTAGGENVAPLPIEEALKETCKIISNIVVLGDDKKYLAALITLKMDDKGNLSSEVLEYIKEINSEATNIVEAINDDNIKFYIQKCIDEVNKKAVSRAQLVRKWTILPNEFSVDSGELTPTLKLKRKFVSQKYAKVIEKMYSDPKF